MNALRCRGLVVLMVLAGAGLVDRGATANDRLAWPAITEQTRPWAYNWWLGSAVDAANLSKELERYRDGGLGGIHIIPIYGAKGYEDKYLDYLSPQWMAMLDHAVREGKRLGLGVDMTTGTGWCFGGPNVPASQAGMLVECKPVSLASGQTWTCPGASDALLALMAVAPDGRRLDQGKLGGLAASSWTADADGWTLYPLLLAKNGPKVKRAAPGGEGFMLNPLDGAAMEHYLQRFSEAFPVDSTAPRPRAMYHDSYEYNSQWSPDFLEQFERRRGYRLQEHLPELFGGQSSDAAARVAADYRETVSDLMIENVFPRWVAWSHARGMLCRDQAHGSPANLLDLYALADIPETEMFGRGNRDPLVSRFEPGFAAQGDREILVSKFASSAAHVAGKPLVAAEGGTWMAEHFCETLEEVKCLMDLFFVAGVNHVFYHGCCYSPDEAAWPGWLFYASTEMNPRNSIWHDAPTLNGYIARCQAVLQSGRPDNDLLLYWPIHDYWHQPDPKLLSGLVVHGRGEKWLTSQPVGQLARQLWNRGFAFDYLSDRQLAQATGGSQGISVPGGAYRTVLVPTTEHMPVATFQKLLALAEAGATVIFQGKLPEEVPGWAEMPSRREELARLRATIQLVPSATVAVQEARRGAGRILVGDAEACLALAGIARETMVDHEGVSFVRRSHSEGRHYFIVNQGAEAIDGWVSLAMPASAVALMDPMSGATGLGKLRQGDDQQTQIYLQLAPGASILLRTFTTEVNGPAWTYVRPAGDPVALTGTWQVTFLEGGPVVPKSYETSQLASWTTAADPEAERFAGTARYTLHFDAPAGERFQLDLGRVCHSARVRLNGEAVGNLILPPYRLVLPKLKAKDNVLEVEVTNLSANRIRDLDRRQVPWRVFQDINLVTIKYRPFDASNWPVFDSGLLGPVTLERVDP